MTRNFTDEAECYAAVLDYLEWQRRLGHPGLPLELIMKRRVEEREQKTAPEPRPSWTPPAARAASPNPASFKPALNLTPAKEAKVHPAATAKPTMAPVAAKSPLFADERKTLEAIRAEIGDCHRCKLGDTRKKLVFGEGHAEAKIMFVGEGPGADEDEQGRPFVGRAGQLLTRWIELGMGIPRSEVYIGNIVKCRPPENRDPEREEVDACIGFIRQQILSIHPKVLVLLGRVPLKSLLGVNEGITKVHGEWFSFEGIPTMALFHPSYCLRPPQDEKRKIVWEDLKKILKFLGMPIPKKG